MKVVHINLDDTYGGAAIACRRHCEAMVRAGIDAKMLVGIKRSSYSFVHMPKYGLGYYWYYVRQILYQKFISLIKSKGTYNILIGSRGVHKMQFVQDADIIYIHWINMGVMSISDITEILKLGKPTVLYMHDMHYITGLLELSIY